MNRSWNNNSSNSSTGFVYFNTSPHFNQSQSSSSLDTPNFLSFGSDNSSGSSPYQFSPSNYSSPSRPYVKNFRARGARNQFYTPVKQSGGKFWRKSAGLTAPTGNRFQNSNEKIYHQSFNQYNHSNKHGGHFNQHRSHNNKNRSVFYDPTCLENPWAELEQKLAEDTKKVTSKSEESVETSQSTTKETEIEVDEVSSGEGESEDDSCEMEESFS